MFGFFNKEDPELKERIEFLEKENQQLRVWLRQKDEKIEQLQSERQSYLNNIKDIEPSSRISPSIDKIYSCIDNLLAQLGTNPDETCLSISEGPATVISNTTQHEKDYMTTQVVDFADFNYDQFAICRDEVFWGESGTDRSFGPQQDILYMEMKVRTMEREIVHHKSFIKKLEASLKSLQNEKSRKNTNIN